MGLYAFRLPDIGEGVAEAEIVAWHVKVGDEVAEDQTLVDVMTDKATVDIASPVRGRVSALYGEVGRTAPIGSVIVELETEGAVGAEPAPAPASEPMVADPSGASPSRELPGRAGGPDPEPAKTPAAVIAGPAKTDKPAFVRRSPDRPPLASPATRRKAHELGIALQFVPGSGPGGRITESDLQAYIDSQALGASVTVPAGARRTAVHETRIIGLRRKIAEKMLDAKRRIPHFTYVEEFDMTALEALRLDLNTERDESQPKLTLLPFFMRAIVKLSPEFPSVNARFDDEAGVLHAYEAVHIGIATQAASGLLVPVVRHAEALDLWDSARELARVTAAARDGTATREELSGSTITLTSLGALGGIAATPVINHPEVAIIGPNKLVERPIVINGGIAVRTMMNLSSSFDHRIVDGYVAARFVHRLKRLIEKPALLFLDSP